jgi:hypothetical protein
LLAGTSIAWPASSAHEAHARPDGSIHESSRAEPADRSGSREGWYCPIGTCGPAATGSPMRGVLAFGAAALVAGVIARRRSSRID